MGKQIIKILNSQDKLDFSCISCLGVYVIGITTGIHRVLVIMLYPPRNTGGSMRKKA